MNKKQYTIPIIGLDKHDNPARIGEDVQSWQNASGQFAAWSDMVNMFVQTHKGITKLEPHKTTKNLWVGQTEGGVKMHVTLKKVTGKIIYWM